MCGIFGTLHLDGVPVDQDELRLMARRMAHRGPDDEGFWVDGPVGVGMRRLSIIDLSGGHQPIGNEDGSIQVVMNGEIYNYRELRERLIRSGHRFATRSDVEVLVHLYEEEGRDCIRHLNGMFAFALYDARRRSLWVARDRLGIKPLFYRHAAQRLDFSSDLNALNAVVHAPVSISAMVAYLAYSYVPAPATMFEGIRKLMPGEELIVEEGYVKTRRYWALAELQSRGDVSVHEKTEALDSLLQDAVRLQLESDVPVGVFLSGGMDSSAIASYVADAAAGQSIRTFTVNFSDKGGNDAEYARAMSRYLGSIHHEIQLTAQQQLQALERLILRMDEPIADSAIVPTFVLSELAASHGVKVLLSGAGGDEIFGGYDRHFPGRLGSAAWFAGFPAGLRMACKPLWAFWNPALLDRLDNPARNFYVATSGTELHLLKYLLGNDDRYRAMLSAFDEDLGAFRTDAAYPRMRLDLKRYLPDNVLSLTDKATMAASVEGRVPLLDHRLVEFAYSLPEAVNLLQGRKKGLFRHVLNARLPASILERGKEGFNAPMAAWIGHWPELLRTELLEHPAHLLRESFRLDGLRDWIEDPGRRQRGGELLYSLYVLSRWLKAHHE
ncbi:MAG: asparagine synthase (glutamine-hydrolyzing) [Gammaproteobacteria bacterium]|nr:asparagine synthase (glutamine-hydrolyzing) [Gammaproteobacteria bacterium]MBU0788315.1 asparagine synthase (glutamine-hydrolyzing) [Gammaproteobacteria bacterium]MBU0815188.1 asparagine synthase (glutamine-hydrolyzing) [Gammaproteobacteria bacterium]MBU1785704.1 asparagine synthase (glutamine-hydrolyzing) [Gammaproteobacteria bacterium]